MTVEPGAAGLQAIGPGPDAPRSWPPPIARPGGALLLGGAGRSAREIVAGITLVALTLPMNIGYASAAGLPATVGIYATVVPLAVFALLTGSRHLCVGPDATVSALLAAGLGPVLALGVAPAEAAWAVSLLVGAMLLAAWALRLGALVRFLSKAVLVGFIAGLAIEILTSQVRKILAVDVEASGWFREVVEIVRAVPDASWASVAVGVSTIALVRLLGRFLPRLPGSLIALVIVGAIVAATDPAGVATLGHVRSGLPRPTFPTLGLDAWLQIVPLALSIAVLTMAEGVLISQNAARRHGEELEPNGEMLAFGASNAAAALTGAMPIGASASRTAALEAAGTSTQVPALVAAAAAAIVVVFFTGLVSAIPEAALGGLVASAVVSTIDIAELRRFARVRRVELAISLGCIAGVLVLGPLKGLALAAVASAIDMVRRAAASPWVQLGGTPVDSATGRFVTGAGGELPEGLVVVRPNGPLFFANADVARETVVAAADDPGVRWLVLDLEVVSDVDPTAADALADGLEAAKTEGTMVALSRVRASLRVPLARYGLLDLVGEEHVFESNRAAASAYQARAPAGRRPRGVMWCHPRAESDSEREGTTDGAGGLPRR